MAKPIKMALRGGKVARNRITEAQCYPLERQLLSVNQKPDTILVWNDNRLASYLRRAGYTCFANHEKGRGKFETVLLRSFKKRDIRNLEYIKRFMLPNGLLAVEFFGNPDTIDKGIIQNGFEYLTITGNFLYYVRSN